LSINKAKVNYDDAIEVKSIVSSESAGFNGVTSLAGTTKLLGNLDLSKGVVYFADGIQSKQGTPSLTEIKVKYFNYTLSSLDDRDSIIEMNNLAANTLTVPLDASTNFPVGTTIDIIQANSGQTTVVAASGVIINATPGFQLRQKWSVATLLKRAPNTWLLFGDLTA
jgi:hypothetical protein